MQNNMNEVKDALSVEELQQWELISEKGIKMQQIYSPETIKNVKIDPITKTLGYLFGSTVPKPHLVHESLNILDRATLFVVEHDHLIINLNKLNFYTKYALAYHPCPSNRVRLAAYAVMINWACYLYGGSVLAITVQCYGEDTKVACDYCGHDNPENFLRMFHECKTLEGVNGGCGNCLEQNRECSLV